MEKTELIDFSSLLGDEEYVKPQVPRNLNDYRLIKLLGKGGQGEVWKAEIKSNRKIIALKVIYVRKGISEYYELALEEVIALEKISKPECHPFLACYYNHSYDKSENRLLIEMELIEGMELFEYSKNLLGKREYRRLYKDLLLITKDINKALIFIHSKDIIHRDVKPNNIIIDNKMVPKLVDFGISCETEFCEKRGTKDIDAKCCLGLFGTPVFIAPEVIEKKVSYPISDLWALGMTLYYSATGYYPFSFTSRNIEDIFNIIKNNEPLKLQTTNKLLNEVVNSLLIKDYEKRMTSKQLAMKLKDL